MTLRGNHRQPIFYENADRDLLDGLVAEIARQLQARIHAYCWMTNHVHLLVQVSDAPLSEIMRRVASRYARFVQSRIATTGHLFERRFHAVLVDADHYLLELVRYIHLNPVRAGLANTPDTYPWSSHHAYVSQRRQDWVTTEFALGLLASRHDTAIMRYRELIASPEPCQWGTGRLAPNAADPRILADDEFVRRLHGANFVPRSDKSLEDLMLECCQRFGLTEVELVSPSKEWRLVNARAWLARAAITGRVASAARIARHLRRTEGAVRQLMKSRRAAGLVE